MSIFTKGDIVIVRFPYTNFEEFKIRPALILSVMDNDDYVVCRISSKQKVDTISIHQKDYVISPLSISSYVNFKKLAAINGTLIMAKASKVAPNKYNEIVNAIYKYIK
ncbi:MAG: type II toxin-antitoxin system PemK/MazF family toxin [Mycoplasmataceae bacterium]|jgi:mRNA interferase MazF|nr:type II toxin-antitoxin system PemK/MazF family toxin [Mycoplasmataceae bacterium]